MPALPWFPQSDYAWLIRDHQWEHDLVELIRRGNPAPGTISVYDACPSSYWECTEAYAEGWDQAEKHSANAIRTGAAYLNDTAIAKRHAENAVRKAAYKEMLAAQKAAAEADRPRREAEKAEKERVQQEYYERQAAWEKERAEQERLWKENSEKLRKRDEQRKAEWEAAAPARRFQEERHRILASKWICTECHGKSTIVEENGGYRLTCTKCGKSAWGSHEAIMKVRQA